jgi:hypothetical protein
MDPDPGISQPHRARGLRIMTQSNLQPRMRPHRRSAVDLKDVQASGP